MKKFKLDKEEKKLLKSVEQGEWQTIPHLKEEGERYAQYAQNTLRKDRRITIRMTNQDLVGIQMKAAGEGIPYQTLITSVIHKYLTGTLAPKSS